MSKFNKKILKGAYGGKHSTVKQVFFFPFTFQGDQSMKLVIDDKQCQSINQYFETFNFIHFNQLPSVAIYFYKLIFIDRLLSDYRFSLIGHRATFYVFD